MVECLELSPEVHFLPVSEIDGSVLVSKLGNQKLLFCFPGKIDLLKNPSCPLFIINNKYYLFMNKY